MSLCRHYVDRICRYTTGIDAATALCKRHAYRLSRQQAPWSDSFMTVAHMLTDVANWPHIRAATQVQLVALLLISRQEVASKWSGWLRSSTPDALGAQNRSVLFILKPMQPFRS